MDSEVIIQAQSCRKCQEEHRAFQVKAAPPQGWTLKHSNGNRFTHLTHLPFTNRGCIVWSCPPWKEFALKVKYWPLFYVSSCFTCHWPFEWQRCISDPLSCNVRCTGNGSATRRRPVQMLRKSTFCPLSRCAFLLLRSLAGTSALQHFNKGVEYSHEHARSLTTAQLIKAIDTSRSTVQDYLRKCVRKCAHMYLQSNCGIADLSKLYRILSVTLPLIAVFPCSWSLASCGSLSVFSRFCTPLLRFAICFSNEHDIIFMAHLAGGTIPKLMYSKLKVPLSRITQTKT